MDDIEFDKDLPDQYGEQDGTMTDDAKDKDDNKSQPRKLTIPELFSDQHGDLLFQGLSLLASIRKGLYSLDKDGVLTRRSRPDEAFGQAVPTTLRHALLCQLHDPSVACSYGRKTNVRHDKAAIVLATESELYLRFRLKMPGLLEL